MASEDQAGGLDSLGGGVPTTETISIGGAKMPLKTVLNSDILKNLQDELDRRSGKGIMGGIDQILQGFKTNAAFTSSDPAQALAALAADRRAEAQDVMGLRNNISAIKQAQMLHDVQAKNLNNLVGGAGGTGGGDAGGTGGTGGGGASEIDPESMNVVRSLMAQNNFEAAQAYYNKAVASRADRKNMFYFNPSSYTKQNVQIGGKSYDLDSIELEALKKMPKDVRAQWLKDKSAEMLGDYNAQQAEGNEPNAVRPAATAPAATAPAATAPAATAPAATAPARLVLQNGKIAPTPQQKASEINAERDSDAASKQSRIQRYTEGYNALLEEQNRNAKPASKTPAPTALAPRTSVPMSQNLAVNAIKIRPLTERDVYPGQPPAGTTEEQKIRNEKVKYLNEKQTEEALKDAAAERDLAKREREHAQDISKREKEKGQDVVGRERETSAAEAGKREAAMRALTQKGMMGLESVNQILSIANDPQYNHVLGHFHGTHPIDTGLYTAAKRMPFSKSPEELEADFVANKLSEKEREKYQLAKTAAAKLGIDYAAEVFQGARLGVGLEKMASNAKGVGTEYSPQTNKRNASLIKDAINFQTEKEDLLRKFKADNRGTFADFEDSPEYIQLKKQTENRLLRNYPGQVHPASPSSAPAGADKFAKFRKPAQ